MSSMKDQIRDGLLDSYRHRAANGASCALCGNNSRSLAFHMLEASFNEGTSLPKAFTPMSASMGRVRGSFPICDTCAPSCKKCQLPIPTEKVMELGHSLTAVIGNGTCQDIQPGLFVVAFFKSLFGIGRFARKP